MGRIACALVVLVALVASAAPTSGQATDDTVFIVKEDNTTPSNADVALGLARETPYSGDRVLVSRDDEFADALASGLLQSDAPLLLVPTAGPIPPAVADQIAALDVSEAVILGGTAAIADSVEEELAALDLTTSRRAGGSRFDTAVAVAAAEAPAADTIMLARAFPAEGSTDASQAFADTLAAGGLSARNGWPILLTQTDQLTGPTRDYLVQAAPARVLVLGGTAAISEAVVEEVAALGIDVSRVAGEGRADTAVEIAKVGGTATAADAARVVVVEAQGKNAWAGGFAAASHAAAFDAPIVLASGTTLPPETEAFLAPGIGGDPSAGPVMTCIVVPDLCETARVTAGLPPMDSSAPPPPPPDFAPLTETFTVELVGNEISTVEFDVARGYVISAEVPEVSPDCGLTGTIQDPGRVYVHGPTIIDGTFVYWHPFQATSAGGTWTIDVQCTTSEESSTTVQLSLVTQSDVDVPTLSVGEVVEFTRSGPASFALYRVELDVETSYLLRQTILIGGATAVVDVITPDGAPYYGSGFTCLGATCEAPYAPSAEGSHLFWASSFEGDRVTYEASIVLAEE